MKRLNKIYFLCALFTLPLDARASSHDVRFPEPVSRAECARALTAGYRPRMTVDLRAFGELVLWVTGQHPAFVRARARAVDRAGRATIDQLPLGFSRPDEEASRWLSRVTADGTASRREIWDTFATVDRDTAAFQTAAVFVLHNVVTTLGELSDPDHHRGISPSGNTAVDLEFTINEDDAPARTVRARFDDHFTAGDLAGLSDLARAARVPSILPLLYVGMCEHRAHLIQIDEDVPTPGSSPPAAEPALIRLNGLISQFDHPRADPATTALTLVNHALLTAHRAASGGRLADVGAIELSPDAWSAADHAKLVDAGAHARADLAIFRAIAPILARASERAADDGSALVAKAVVGATETIRRNLVRRSADLRALDRATFLSSIVALRELFGTGAIDEAAVNQILARDLPELVP